MTTGALSKHINAAAAYERPDVPQLAEEHVAHDVAPEPDRNHVFRQQALVAHPDVVLRKFGAKRRSDRRTEHDISKLGKTALVTQIYNVTPLNNNHSSDNSLCL